MVSEKIFFTFPNNKSMGAIDPQGVASFDYRDLISRISRHCNILKYINCGPNDFSEDFF